MPTNHRIASMRLEIAYDSAVIALNAQDSLAPWLQKLLLPRMEHLLDELFAGPQLVCIEKISLELDHCDSPDFWDKLPEIFEESLREALRPYVPQISNSIPNELHSNAQACLEIMEQICTPLLPSSAIESSRDLRLQAARNHLSKHPDSSLLDLAQAIIIAQTHANPALQARQLATAALPRLQSRIPKPPGALPLPPKPSQFIENAGLVITGPYLTHLFAMLNLTESNQFTNPAEALKAAQVLRYVVYGEYAAAPPPGPLENILCGLPLNTPHSPEATIGQDSKNVVEQMLQSIVHHWKALGATSVQGLRSAFLCRTGRLEFHNESWQLLVENGAYDVLLDRIPWGITPLKLPWMPQALHVSWR